ncbi:3-ketoacyl-ACP reductase [Cephaloticoccus primus]|uniref:3-ketoacyl-ACP reductase n=1 Tax=Cephaloticoccus primus TaxID=1548207 RepID=A0A139SRC2_9BACT|nr:3-ketoacyl-ACP reductase [Cephaloticoccus primus]KXU37149.1 3-ketoacyl-ACP reductase [Cephaloticoccus primus]
MTTQKTALVTGASRGIGRGIAIELARAGCRVAINYAGNAAAAAEALALVREAGGEGLTVQGDIASAADRERLVAQACEGLGGRIDLLVNNAGVAPTVRADLLDAGEESFDRLFAINLKGPFFLSQRVAKQMLAQAPDAEGFRGRIVTITSISAYTASTNRGDYCMVKAGLAMMTKLFADRLAAAGINVYEIRPGVIATDMTGAVKDKYDQLILREERGITPLRRWGQPSDIGRAVRAIAEDRFPFSTGACFDVDGGFHLHRI